MARAPEHHLEVSVTVGAASTLVVLPRVKRLLTLGTSEMLDMPLFSQGVDHSLLDRTMAAGTDRNSHLIMTAQTIQFIQFAGSVALSRFELASQGVQFDTARFTVEVVGMVDLAAVSQRLAINHATTSVADMTAGGFERHLGVTAMTQRLIHVFDKAHIGQLTVTRVTAKTVSMPAAIQSLDHPAHDKLITLFAARCKQHLKVVFTVLASVKLEEHALRKRLEALRAHETLRMPELAGGVDYLLGRPERQLTAGAYRVRHGHDAEVKEEEVTGVEVTNVEDAEDQVTDATRVEVTEVTDVEVEDPEVRITEIVCGDNERRRI